MRYLYQVDGHLRIDPEPGVHANAFFSGGPVGDVVHRQLNRQHNQSIDQSIKIFNKQLSDCN